MTTGAFLDGGVFINLRLAINLVLGVLVAANYFLGCITTGFIGTSNKIS